MSMMFTQSSAIVDSSMVVSLPNAPALDVVQRIVKKRKAELVRRLALAAIFKPREGVSLGVLEDCLAFCEGWARYVIRRSLRGMASRSAAMAVPACPQFDEIVPTSRNTIIVKRLAVTTSEPQVPAPSVEDVVWILNACIPALDGFWLDDAPALLHNLQANIPPMALSTTVPRGAHISVDFILLLASRASCYTSLLPLLVDLGPETSIVSVTLDDGNGDDNTLAGVSPAEAPNKVLVIKEPTVVCSKLQVPFFSARDITVILDDLNLCVSALASLWFDIPISLYDLQVDVSMYPSGIPQPEGCIDINLILLLAPRATCCGSLLSLVDIGPSDTSIVEVVSDDVEVWTDLNHTLVDEDLEIIFSPQNILVKKFSTIIAKPRVSTFSIRDIVGILGDLDLCAFASKSAWLDLPGLSRDIRLDVLPLVVSATPQLGDRVNVDLVLLLASMVISRTSSFPRIVDLGTSSIVEVTLDGEDLMDNDHTLIEISTSHSSRRTQRHLWLEI